MAHEPAYHFTASQWASATMHLEQRESWRVVRIGGIRYVVLASGTSGHVYHARSTADGCSCPFYATTARRCSHLLALELAALEDELTESASVPTLRSFQDLYPGCAAGCGDLVEKRGERCDLCSRTEVRRLDAESRAAVFATIAPFTLNPLAE